MNKDAVYGTGVVKRLMPQGYGFITKEDGQDIFFHASNADTPFETLNEGDKVNFEVKPTRKGDNAFHVVIT